MPVFSKFSFGHSSMFGLDNAITLTLTLDSLHFIIVTFSPDLQLFLWKREWLSSFDILITSFMFSSICFYITLAGSV